MADENRDSGRGSGRRPMRSYFLCGLNMQKVVECSNYLEDKLRHVNKPFICTVQEPPNRKNLNFNPRWLQILQGKTTAGLPTRAGIVASKDINLTKIPNLCDRDTVCAVWETKGCGNTTWNKHRTLIVSGYWERSNNVRTLPKSWEKAADYGRDHGLEVYFQVDANARSELFGGTVGPNDTGRRDKLEEFLEKNCLIPVNTGSTPTWSARGLESVIDLTFATADLARKLSNYQVHVESNYSDHWMTSTEMLSYPPEREWMRDLNGVDWRAFTKSLEEALVDHELILPKTIRELDAKTDEFHNTIMGVLNVVAPLKLKRVKKCQPGFWNQELQDRQTELKKLYKRYRGARGNAKASLQAEHRKMVRLQKRRIKHHKKWAWRRLGFETDSHEAMAKLNKMLKAEKSTQVDMLKRNDGTYTNSIPEVMELMMETNFPGCKKDWSEPEEDRGFVYAELEWLGRDRIVRAIARMKPSKTAGPDELKPVVLQNLTERALDILNMLYNASICAGYVPERWKRSKIVMLPKPGKASYDNVKSFRPITLSNHILKVLERLSLWRMEEVGLDVNPISDNQHAYRSDRSCETAAHKVQSYIERGRDAGDHVVVVSLDVASAFNGILADALIDSMMRRGVDPEIVKWYKDLITNRRAELSIKGNTIRVEIKRGVPQGGVIAVLCWNLSADDLIDRIKKLKLNLESVVFADDANIMGRGDSLPDVVKRVQKGLEEASNWAKDKGLSISAEKTSWTLYTRKRNKYRTVKMFLEGKEIQRVDETKYLGFYFDTKMNWVNHIEKKMGQARKALFLYKKAWKSNWGPHHKAMNWLWTCAVRPIITYGAMVWGHVASNAGISEKLRSLQRFALMQYGQLRKNTPKRALEVVTGTMPPGEIRQ